jgi:hypothetical protein
MSIFGVFYLYVHLYILSLLLVDSYYIKIEVYVNIIVKIVIFLSRLELRAAFGRNPAARWNKGILLLFHIIILIFLFFMYFGSTKRVQFNVAFSVDDFGQF